MFKDRKTVGVRIPNHSVPIAILHELGIPMMTASLRTDEGEEEEYMTDPELIEEKYGGVELLIDAGIGGRVPSTIVDCTGDEPLLVRQGAGAL